MKILSLECSASPASAAVSEDGKILSSAYSNVKLTHSETLLPMAGHALDSAKLDMSQIDGFAVSVGPGSFTGIRIGVSALKGMAWAVKKPCAAVSTLAGMAAGLALFQGVIVCAMDARCAQVYNALFYADGTGSLTRLCDDRALFAADLAAELKNLAAEQYPGRRFLFAGDGAAIAYEAAAELDGRVLAPEHLRYQNACGVAAAAAEQFRRGEGISAAELMPAYLRLPQAERELKAKRTAQK